MPKHIVTQEDLDHYPNLATEGIQVGDEIDVPELGADIASKDDAPADGPGPRPKDRNNP